MGAFREPVLSEGATEISTARQAQAERMAPALCLELVRVAV